MNQLIPTQPNENGEVTKMEMAIYYSGKDLIHEVPENIITDVRNTFTKFEVEYADDGTVIVKVPKKEMEVITKLKENIYLLLKEVKEENSVLAVKLARRYGF